MVTVRWPLNVEADEIERRARFMMGRAHAQVTARLERDDGARVWQSSWTYTVAMREER